MWNGGGGGRGSATTCTAILVVKRRTLLHGARGAREGNDGGKGEGGLRGGGRDFLRRAKVRGPPGRAFVPSTARDLEGVGAGRGQRGDLVLSPRRSVASNEMHFSAAQKRRRRARARARPRFRERKNMMSGQLTERWPRATRKRLGDATRRGTTVPCSRRRWDGTRKLMAPRCNYGRIVE